MVNADGFIFLFKTALKVVDVSKGGQKKTL